MNNNEIPNTLPEELYHTYRRVVRHDSVRILRTIAKKLERRGLVYILPNSEYRRSEFGKEIGPIFVTVLKR